jgi:hypothetical protein
MVTRRVMRRCWRAADRAAVLRMRRTREFRVYQSNQSLDVRARFLLKDV